jgi:hypothetical protein
VKVSAGVLLVKREIQVSSFQRQFLRIEIGAVAKRNNPFFQRPNRT